MREIKFRQKLNKKASDINGEAFHYWGYLDDGFTTPMGKNFTEGDDQQYTGLKDKNGVEIYEGDILETPYEVGSNDFMDVDEDEGVYRGKVHYRPSKGFIQTKCLKFSDCEASSEGVKRPDLENISQYKCMVIGNIHQNPELIE